MRHRQFSFCLLVFVAAGFAGPLAGFAHAGPLSASRTENADGSASLASNWALPTPWDSKVGVHFTLPEAGAAPSPASTAASAGTGAAWANLTVPGTWLPVWDKVSLNARVDPYGREGALGTTFSRAVPAGHGLAVSVENSYALSHSAAPAAGSPETVSGGGSVSLGILATATTLSAGTTVSSGAEPWSATLSAGQKLFGLIELNAAMSESESGASGRRLGASYRRKF
jgi:hypothetical protein